jgi:16S rRNA (cytosine(967)-C(5))-methyltransferase
MGDQGTSPPRRERVGLRGSMPLCTGGVARWSTTMLESMGRRTVSESSGDAFGERRRKEYLAFLVVKFLKAHVAFEAIHASFREATAAGSLATSGVYEQVRELEENLAFELKEHPPLAKLPSFAQGFFYIQDPSTLLAVQQLNPQPGERVLDLCAAPGGKLTYIAQRMQNNGFIVAHDTSPERLHLVEENCRRLGVTCAHMVASLANLKFPGSKPFDRILIDAPCSNTGVLRRRVDLRWRIRPEELERLRRTQLELLREAAALLTPVGTILYSTCSLEPEENSKVVQEFLSGNRGFKLECERELLPFADQVDGCYVARLKRCG